MSEFGKAARLVLIGLLTWAAAVQGQAEAPSPQEGPAPEVPVVQPAPLSEQPWGTPEASDSGLLTVIGYLFVLGLAAAGFVYLTRRGKLRLPAALGGDGAIRVVTTKALGNRNSLLLIELDQQRLLLGVGPQGVQRLHVYPAPSFAEIASKLEDER